MPIALLPESTRCFPLLLRVSPADALKLARVDPAVIAGDPFAVL